MQNSPDDPRAPRIVSLSLSLLPVGFTKKRSDRIEIGHKQHPHRSLHFSATPSAMKKKANYKGTPIEKKIHAGRTARAKKGPARSKAAERFPMKMFLRTVLPPSLSLCPFSLPFFQNMTPTPSLDGREGNFGKGSERDSTRLVRALALPWQPVKRGPKKK